MTLRSFDCSQGGGQIVRTLLALIALYVSAGTQIVLTNIREKRPKPGLADQHLQCIRAAAKLRGGFALSTEQIDAIQIGARQVTLAFADDAPRSPVDVECEGLGSLTLIVQSILPYLAFRADPSPMTVRIRGGSRVAHAPWIEHTQHVLLPILRRWLGVRAELRYDPSCDEEANEPATATLEVSSIDADRNKELRGLDLRRPWSKYESIKVFMDKRANNDKVAYLTKELAAKFPGAKIEVARTVPWIPHWLKGNAKFQLLAVTDSGDVLGANSVADLLRYYECKACVDDNTQDQLLVLMALVALHSGEASAFRCGQPTEHTADAIRIIECFFEGRVRFSSAPVAYGTAAWEVRCELRASE